MPLITLQDVFLSYGQPPLIDHINLTIEPGERVCLIGRNGAGKSTLMRTIAALQEADSGMILLGDVDVAKEKQALREILGYLPQEFGVYPKVSAIDLLDHMAVMKGITDTQSRKEQVESLLYQVNLWDSKEQKLGTFSGGMKQRFGIAQALLGDPKLIIVDEPTAGLDPMQRNRFHNLLSAIGENVIVILSTHIVDDVSDLCNDMAIILNGELKLSGKPLELIKRLEGKVWQGLVEKDITETLNDDERLIFSRLYMGKVKVRLLSDGEPMKGFKLNEPEIEDLYFATINDFQI